MQRILKFLFIPLLMSTLISKAQEFEIEGHRGSRGLLPENTLPSFYKAVDLGVQIIELDVVISADKKVVVSHDPFFNTAISSKPDGTPLAKDEHINLYQLPYSEIKKFDVGKRGNPGFPEQEPVAAYKPLLSEVLKKVEKYASKKGVKDLKYNIEIKSSQEEYGISQPEVEEFSELVHDEIFRYVPAERVVLQSFDFNVLKYWFIRISAGEFQPAALAVLIEPGDNNDIDHNLNLLGFKPQIWSPYFKQVTKERVEKLHSMGIRVIPWTINEISDMKKVKEMGVDGLITDYPNRARNL